MLANQQEEQQIQDKLHALDLEYHGYHSQDLLVTIQKSKFLLPKAHSFREVSDWSERYQLEESTNSLVPKDTKRIKRIEEEYHNFAASLSKRKLIKINQEVALTNKQKVELAPINVKFANCRSKSKLKRKESVWSPKEGNVSFYEANYQPLNLLYKLKTKEKDERRSSQVEELPLILPQSPKSEQHKLPRTQRVSSILRKMKQNQQINQLRRKQLQNRDIFQMES